MSEANEVPISGHISVASIYDFDTYTKIEINFYDPSRTN